MKIAIAVIALCVAGCSTDPGKATYHKIVCSGGGGVCAELVTFENSDKQYIVLDSAYRSWTIYRITQVARSTEPWFSDVETP